ncbi:MAG: HAD family hydrolase [Planctomycetaceae bacterium]|nr:MAG: HAD family hydrolase [Planctomycetaceae bacterium]
MITTVLFDIYGTLLDVITDEESLGAFDILSRWLEYKRAYITPEQLRWFYKEEFARRLGMPERQRAETDLFMSMAGQPFARGTALFLDADVVDVFRTILTSCCGLEGAEPDHLPEDCAHLFRAATRKDIFLYPTVKPALALIKKGYKLGIVSNAQEAFTMPELDLYHLRPYFEEIVLSSQAGVRKPNPMIFQRALDNLGAGPHQAVFVGNDLIVDILGARRLGMKTILVGPGDPNVRGVVPDATVRDVNFYEVKNIVDRWNEQEKT